jgi:hypothetical protein
MGLAGTKKPNHTPKAGGKKPSAKSNFTGKNDFKSAQE